MEKAYAPIYAELNLASTGNAIAASALKQLRQSEPVTMSSREIAELVESRHDSVKRTIERLVEKTVIRVPPLVEYKDGLGRPANEYLISKRDSYVIVAQLSPEFTARLVDRWQELEERAATPQPAIPQTYSAALRLAADLVEQNTQLVATVANQAPKVEALERIAVAEGSLCIRDAAKALQIRPTDLFAWLNHHGWIFKHPDGSTWRAYQAKIDRGLLEVKIGRSSAGKSFAQVLIKSKGLTALATILGQTKAGNHSLNEKITGCGASE